MPYKTPEWALKAQNKFDSLIPSLGKLGTETIKYTEDGGIGVNNLPMPGTFRQTPDVGNVVMPSMPQISDGGGGMVSAFSSVVSSGRDFSSPQTVDRGINVGYMAPNLKQGLKITIKQVGKFLQKSDPSSIAGMIKATVKETWGAGERMLGAFGVGSYMMATDPLFRKYAMSRIGTAKLTPEEQKEFDNIYVPALLDMLRGAGFKDEDINDNSALFRRWVSDLFTLETTAATLWSGGSSLVKATKAVPMAISSFNAGMNKKIVAGIVDDAFKKGITLTVDTADNVFAVASRKEAIKRFFGLINTAMKPTAKIISTGLAFEATNAVRKYIDPDTAERIARDQRSFIDSLSTAEMLALDLGIGVFIPLEIPGLNTLRSGMKTFDDYLDFELGSKAFYNFFSDDESIKVLNKLSEFSDLQSGIGADHAARATLLSHTLTVMQENGISSKNFEHFIEMWGSWANKVDDVDTLAYLRRLDNEGTRTALSWYSKKLGRALTSAESLKHWFVTSIEGRFVGDLGDELSSRFDDAVKIATEGLPETTSKINRTVEQVTEIKKIVGKVVVGGDARKIRDALDVLEAKKANLLAELDDTLRTMNYKFINKGGKLFVPKAVSEVPEVRRLLDAMKDIAKTVDDAKASGVSFGIGDDILTTLSNSKLVELNEAYTRFTGNIMSSATMANARAVYSDELMGAFNVLKEHVGGYTGAYNKLVGGDGASLWAKILTESDSAEVNKALKLVKETLVGKVLAPAASDVDVAKFVLAFPTSVDDVGDVAKSVVKVLTKDQKRVLKMQEAISNFDKRLVAIMRAAPTQTQVSTIEKTVTEIRRVEATLPRGMFVPEFMAAHFSRWGKGITRIPMVDIPREGAVRQLAKAVADLQDANGVTRFIADYLVPHPPSDIYVKAMTRLESTLDTLSPGNKESILRDLAKIQDEGISLIPVLPGGGPKWEALGKPMVTGLQWRDLDRVGKVYGVDNLGKLVHESFVTSMSISGFKPGIVDRLRAAPGLGALYDSLYKQYMLTRFAINPVFHAQQVPEAALIGMLRSFNLPKELAGGYIEAITKLPLSQLDAAELRLFNRLRGDLVSKVAKKGSAIAEATQETRFMEDLIQSTGLEERKRLRAFIAEFPVQVRGSLFEMPILNNTDPLMIPEYKKKILSLMNNPDEISKIIGEAYDRKDEFDPWSEAVLRSIRKTNVEVQKVTSYNLNRSALEKDLHAILFPFSFGKKTWSEVAGFVGGGSVARPAVVGRVFTGVDDLQYDESVMEINARYPTWTGWIYNMSMINPQYPLVNSETGSAWFGGLRGSPAQAVLFDTLVGGRYDAADDPEAALRKLGGGGASFWVKGGRSRSGAGQAYMEVFRQGTAEQQRNYIYLLRRMKLEKQLREQEEELDR